MGGAVDRRKKRARCDKIADYAGRSNLPFSRVRQLSLSSSDLGVSNGRDPSKRNTSTQCGYDVGPPSTTLAQHQIDIVCPVSRVWPSALSWFMYCAP